MDTHAWYAAYNARDDLKEYPGVSLGLFALALRYGLDDLHSVAADAITEGSHDKSCDLIHIDYERAVCIIAQCYISSKPNKPSAPSSKAASLTSAVQWLLSSDEDDLPDSIRTHAIDLRRGIQDGTVERLEFWYVHNLPESKNVADELKTVRSAAESAVASSYDSIKVDCRSLEVGVEQLSTWYAETQSPILVTEKISLKVDDGIVVSGEHWSSYVTAIQLSFLQSMYKKHGTKLFSANVRDYLGSRESDSNINNGIKLSAEQNPGEFWIYNNGLTILTNDFEERSSKGKKSIHITGISIVNGAQTTGAVGSITKTVPSNAKVSARFIKTSNSDLIDDITRYNNSQNKVSASDFRSTDQIQKRLKREMEVIPGAEYDGGRRGGASDAIKRRPKLLPSYSVGQALAAFHGDPTIAYNQKSDIWINDGIYSRYFNDDTTARHIVFAYSLVKAVEDVKSELIQKSRTEYDSMTDEERQYLDFLRRRGSNYLMTAAISHCLETILGKKIKSRFDLSFGHTVSPDNAKKTWRGVVDVCLPFSEQLNSAFTSGLQNRERIEDAISTFRTLVRAIDKSSKPASFKRLARAVKP